MSARCVWSNERGDLCRLDSGHQSGHDFSSAPTVADPVKSRHYEDPGPEPVPCRMCRSGSGASCEAAFCGCECHRRAAPVCASCGDHHSVVVNERWQPCTSCPTPCQKCRRDCNGSYCATTPCPCTCHVKGSVDMVNHPPHYKAGGIEAIDVIEAFELNYRLGAAAKYILRHAKKGTALEDLKKARWYLDREITRLEGGAK